MAGAEGVEPSLPVSKTVLQTATTYPKSGGHDWCRPSFLRDVGATLLADELHDRWVGWLRSTDLSLNRRTLLPTELLPKSGGR